MRDPSPRKQILYLPHGTDGMAAIAETVGQPVDYRPVETDGAARAAALIAPLLEESKGRRAAVSRP